MILNCPECGKRLRVRDELAGKRGKCPGCGAVLRVPELPSGVQEIMPRTTSRVLRGILPWIAGGIIVGALLVAFLVVVISPRPSRPAPAATTGEDNPPPPGFAVLACEVTTTLSLITGGSAETKDENLCFLVVTMRVPTDALDKDAFGVPGGKSISTGDYKLILPDGREVAPDFVGTHGGFAPIFMGTEVSGETTDVRAAWTLEPSVAGAPLRVRFKDYDPVAIPTVEAPAVRPSEQALGLLGKVVSWSSQQVSMNVAAAIEFSESCEGLSRASDLPEFVRRARQADGENAVFVTLLLEKRDTGIERIREVLGKEDETETGELLGVAPYAETAARTKVTWYKYNWLYFAVADGNVLAVRADCQRMPSEMLTVRQPDAGDARKPEARQAELDLFEPYRLSSGESSNYDPMPVPVIAPVWTGNIYDNETRTLITTDRETKAFRTAVGKLSASDPEGRRLIVEEFVKIYGEERARKIGLVFYDDNGKAAYCWPRPSR